MQADGSVWRPAVNSKIADRIERNVCHKSGMALAMPLLYIAGAGAPDAVGDTMNEGKIIVHGNIGDAAGGFLGEYQAGGVIVVLGLTPERKKIVGYFPCTGMHGGKLFLRSDCRDVTFPGQVTARPADERDREELKQYIDEYCSLFSFDRDQILEAPFTVVTPDSKNPYRQMYVAN